MQAAFYPGSIVSIPSGEHEILALLHHGDPVHPAATCRPAVLRLHGMMGNLLDETESYLSEALAGHGITSMTINTFGRVVRHRHSLSPQGESAIPLLGEARCVGPHPGNVGHS